MKTIAPVEWETATKLPPVMTGTGRWVRRVGKRPVTCEGRPASSTNRDTWALFGRVFESRAGDGFGFMLGNGFGCIDLDHCVDGGVVAGWALRILELCPPTYVELSLSGTGLHVFGWIREDRGRRIDVAGGGGIEIYSRARFIATTGWLVPGAVSEFSPLDGVVKVLNSL